MNAFTNDNFKDSVNSEYKMLAKYHFYSFFLFLILSVSFVLFFNNFTNDIATNQDIRFDSFYLFHYAIVFMLFMASSEDLEIESHSRIILYVVYTILCVGGLILLSQMIFNKNFLFNKDLTENDYLAVKEKNAQAFSIVLSLNLGSLFYAIFKNIQDFSDKYNILFFILMPILATICIVAAPIYIIYLIKNRNG